MIDQTVTQAELASLSKKLDELGDVLSPSEQSLLLAVFTLAAQALQAKMRHAGNGNGHSHSHDNGNGNDSESGSVRLPGTNASSLGGRSLSDGFRNTFKAIGNNAFTIRDNNIAAGGVGIGVIW